MSAENWAPAWLAYEPFEIDEKIIDGLRLKGHDVVDSDWGAVVQMIGRYAEEGAWVASSDPRKDGAPARTGA